MSKNIIDQNWPTNELEEVDNCPYCQSKERTLAYKDVQDKIFYCAPGKWNYWNCIECESLYLSPRPIVSSIGKAYDNYYTHVSAASFFQKIKTLFRNEYYSHEFKMDILPRINLPKPFGISLKVFKLFIKQPFELESLVKLEKGRLIDVGCGSGHMLKLAQQLGWDVTGIEIDPKAVAAARAQGLNVVQGDYRQLTSYREGFDCIICSHVLEHVHDPLELLELLENKLKKNGLLLLSVPNATSHMRTYFGKNWRGLEPPRHLAIPSTKNIFNKFPENNINLTTNYFTTYNESKLIEKQAAKINAYLKLKFLITKLNASLKFKRDPVLSDFLLIKYRKF